MPKGRRVRRALEKRFVVVHQEGSHITFRVGPHSTRVYAYHDTRELGERHLRMIAKQFGLSLAELKELL